MSPDDEAWVRRCLEGDERAFGNLVDRYQGAVYNAALRLVGNPDDARDITQTVFLKAFEKLHEFDPQYRFFSWIYRIAINQSLHFLGSRKQVEPLQDRRAVGSHGPAESLEHAERERLLQRALLQLGPEHRTVIVLRHFHDCSYREIAEILDLPEKTVKSRLFSARQLLKEIVARTGIVG